MTRLASRTLLVFIVVALLAVIGSFLVPLRVIAENSPAATFRFGGLERTYRVFRPATLAKSAPVRPKPDCTSSAMKRMPCLWQSSINTLK